MYDKAINGTLCQDVVSQLSKMILDGSIKKGEKLPSEGQLCQLFGVSRTTVRHALQILSARKVIRTQQGKRAVVISDSFPRLNEGLRGRIEEYKSNFEHAVHVRRMLEPQIAFEAACRATEEDVKALESIMDICMQKNAEGTLTTDDMRLFHLRIADIPRNPVLVSLVELLIGMCDSPPDTEMHVPNPSVSVKPNVLREHQAILDAIRERRPDDAYFLMKQNIVTFRKNSMDEIG